ncbi:MAG: rRNA maturation RNase YbeY [Clostridia bacterium]|nr:rRNA maturation RNase YbeY [Clostridia bacterium]
MVVDKTRVIIVNRQKEVKIPTGIRMLIRRCCNAVLKLEKFKGSAEISVTIVDNAYIQGLNKQYRDKDLPTDVLSFPMGKDGVYEVDPETNAKLLGDIVISMEKVREQSKIYGHSLRREVAYLTAHCMLHLLGYDHEQGGIEKMHMREREDRILDLLGFSNAVSYVSDDETR